MKLREILGACMYNWYGAGGHTGNRQQPFSISGPDLITADGKLAATIRALPKFNHRAFVDNWIVVPEKESNNQTFTLKTEPTEQNFYFDSFFKLQKANGLTNIWSASGCFDWYKPALGSNSQRKSACYDPNISPNLPSAWADLAHLCKLIAERYKDNGLVDYIQVLNEWDFRWNVPHVVTPQEYAVCFKVCYEAIRSVSPTQGIIAGCTLNADIQTAEAFISALEALYAAEGKPMPTDWDFSVNNYFRIGDANQGNGIGATPEEVDRYGVYFKPLNDLLTEKGINGFHVTETGYNTSPSTSVAAMKNKAPALEGFTLEEAQGILAIRTALILGSLPKCKGIYFYHCKDGYEAEPFTYHGFNYDKDFGGKEDWSAKPARIICEEFLAKYGEREVAYYRSYMGAGINEIEFTDGTFLTWTNKVNYQHITPKPTETKFTHNMWHPKKVGTEIHRSDNGERFIIRELNSPETILRQSLADFKAIVDYAVDVCELNTLYATLYAGDKYSSTLHPYNGSKVVNGKSFGAPESGFAQARIDDWKVKLEYAASKGMLLHLLLSEKENHFIRNDQQEKEFIDRMVAEFGHLPIIWDREEFPLGKDDFIQVYSDYIANADPNNLIGLHGNTDETPWLGHAGRVHVASIQSDVNRMTGFIEREVARGYIAYASEATGTHAAGDTAKAAKLRDAGGTLSSGAGIYIAPLDQDATLNQLKAYESVFKELSKTSTQPPTMARKIFITTGTTANYDLQTELTEGENVPAGTYAMYVDGAGGVTLSLDKDGVNFIPSRTENGLPLAFGGDDGGKLRLKSFPAGNYVAKVSGQDNLSFTVGTVTPPPTNEPVTETYIENGTHVVFKTAGNMFKAPVTKV